MEARVAQAAPHDDGASTVSPRLVELLCSLLLVLLTLAPNTLINGDGDSAHHIAAGRLILNSLAIPSTYTLSHAHLGAYWLNWEWLSEAIFAAADRLLGLNGVGLLSATLIAGTIYGLCRWNMARGLHPVPALLVGMLAVVTSEIHWLARPHLFSFPLMLAVLYLLEEYRTGRLRAIRLLLVPLITVFWANLHASFVIGLVLCGAYMGGAAMEFAVARARGQNGQAAWRSFLVYGATLAGATMSTLLNPYGINLHLHIVEFLRTPLLTGITVEFLPPDFSKPITWPFLVMLVGMVALLAARWRHVPAVHWLLLIAWTVLSFRVVRNIFHFSILVPALLAPQLVSLLESVAHQLPLLRRYGPGTTPPRQGRPLLFAGAVALALLAATTGGRPDGPPLPRARFTDPPFPLAAIEYLRSDPRAPQGEMFNYMIWGGYFLYELYPRHLIFIDSQTDVYGDQLNRDYLAVATLSPGWPAVLDQYGVDWVIWPRDDGLATALRSDPGWAVHYEDNTAVILIRR